MSKQKMGKSHMLSQLIEAESISIHLINKISHVESADWGRKYTIHPINKISHVESADWGMKDTIQHA